MIDNSEYTKLQIPVWILKQYPELLKWTDFTLDKPPYFIHVEPLKVSEWAVNAWYSEDLIFQCKLIWDEEYIIQFRNTNSQRKIYLINKVTLEYKELPSEEWIRVYDWEINTKPEDLKNKMKTLMNWEQKGNIILKRTVPKKR